MAKKANTFPKKSTTPLQQTTVAKERNKILGISNAKRKPVKAK